MFTELIEKLGVKGAQFSELLSIDPESLAQVQPLYGLIFLFKYRASEIKQRRIKQEAAGAGAVFAPGVGEYDEISATLSASEYPNQSVFFAHQKIQNACATQAVLSLLLNLDKSSGVELGETVKNFGEFADAFDPELRGETISNSEEIRAVHNSFSRPNPFIDEDNKNDEEQDENNDGLYHFISYLPINGKLYELDGLHAYPITHGACSPEEFSTKVSQVLQNRVASSPEGEMRFALLGLTADQRVQLKAIGDTEGLAREIARREEWRRENVLRRENFIGLINSLAKSISTSLTDEEWQKEIIENGRKQSQKRITESSARQAWYTSLLCKR